MDLEGQNSSQNQLSEGSKKGTATWAAETSPASEKRDHVGRRRQHALVGRKPRRQLFVGGSGRRSRRGAGRVLEQGIAGIVMEGDSGAGIRDERPEVDGSRGPDGRGDLEGGGRGEEPRGEGPREEAGRRHA